MDALKPLQSDLQRVSDIRSTTANLAGTAGVLGIKSFSVISDVDASFSSGAFGLIDGASLIPTLECVYRGFKDFSTSTKISRLFASFKAF